MLGRMMVAALEDVSVPMSLIVFSMAVGGSPELFGWRFSRRLSLSLDGTLIISGGPVIGWVVGRGRAGRGVWARQDSRRRCSPVVPGLGRGIM